MALAVVILYFQIVAVGALTNEYKIGLRAFISVME
jgi:hypothetical protein